MVVRRWSIALALAIVAVSCAEPAPQGTDPSSTTDPPTTTITTSTTVAETSTTTTLGDGVLVTRCGRAEFAFGVTEPAGEPLDEEARAAFDEAGEEVAVEWFGEGGGFGGGWEWIVIERDDQRMVFLGTGPNGFADVVIERLGDRWDAAGWGTCHFITASTMPEFGIATWVTDPDSAPDPRSTTLDALVMERNCANGEPPVGREIRSVVLSDKDTVEIVVLIEAVEGFANCPGNPWHATILDIGEPLGERTLVDRHVSPGLVRPWPPTESSIQSGGSDE